MRLAAGLCVAGLLLGAAPASAQYFVVPGFQVPRPPMALGPGLIESAAEIVEAMGLQPVGPALRSGAFLVQRATDDYGRVLRVTVDARRSQVIAVEAAPRGPYAAYVPYGPYRGPYAGMPPDEALAPRGSVMAAREPMVREPTTYEPHRALPPRSASIVPDLPVPPPPGAKPKSIKAPAKSAAITPQHPHVAPTPRKRPATAPQQAAGSVEPVAPAAAPQPAPASPPAAVKPDNAMPPVAPLE